MQFEKAIQALCDGGVDFVIIGGVSATLHGSASVTYDLDICYDRAAANLERLAVVLAPFHPRPREFPKDVPFLWDAGTLRSVSILTLETDLGALDLMAEVAGLGNFSDVKDHSIMVEAFEREVATLNLRALIQAKRAAGRQKDISALPELESLLEAGEPE